MDTTPVRIVTPPSRRLFADSPREALTRLGEIKSVQSVFGMGDLTALVANGEGNLFLNFSVLADGQNLPVTDEGDYARISSRDAVQLKPGLPVFILADGAPLNVLRSESLNAQLERSCAVFDGKNNRLIITSVPGCGGH